ncbi:hypothetical protein JCM16408A_43900 [Methylobacterium phyllosphaerae]
MLKAACNNPNWERFDIFLGWQSHHRRGGLADKPTPEPGRSAYRQSEWTSCIWTTDGGRKRNGRLGDGRPEKRTASYRPKAAVAITIVVSHKQPFANMLLGCARARETARV